MLPCWYKKRFVPVAKGERLVFHPANNLVVVLALPAFYWGNERINPTAVHFTVLYPLSYHPHTGGWARFELATPGSQSEVTAICNSVRLHL